MATGTFTPSFINERVRDEYFLRSSDMREYLLDMDQETGFIGGRDLSPSDLPKRTAPFVGRWPRLSLKLKKLTIRGAFERPLLWLSMFT